MKCNQCNGTNLVKAKFPLECSDISWYRSKSVDVYLCLDCGHYDFFSSNVVSDYKETISFITEKNEEYSQINSNLSEYKKKLETKTNELKNTESQLNSLDITIRQQQEFQKQVSDLKIDIKNISYEIFKAEEKIKKILKETEAKKKDFTNRYEIRINTVDIFDENT